MDDELPSESTRRLSSYPSTRKNKKSMNTSSFNNLPQQINEKPKSKERRTTSVIMKSALARRKNDFKKQKTKSILVTRKKKTISHSTPKTTRSQMMLHDLISTDDEIEVYNDKKKIKLDSNVSLSDEIDYNIKENLVNHNVSFDSSQTTDIEYSEQEQNSRKTTTRLKEDVLKHFTKNSDGSLKYNLCKISAKVRIRIFMPLIRLIHLNLFSGLYTVLIAR